MAAVVTGISPLFHYYAYGYCADILSAALLVAGLGLVFSQRGFLAGLVLGISVWAKLPNVIGLGLAAGMLLITGKRRTLMSLGLGSSVGLGLFGAINWYMFSAPWTTGYQKVMIVERGEVRLSTHMSSFGLPFFKGLSLQLTDTTHGLLPTAWSSVLGFLGGLFLITRKSAALITMLLFMLVTFLFYCKYDFVSASGYSNRFLMPAVALSAIPLAVLLDRLVGTQSGSST